MDDQSRENNKASRVGTDQLNQVEGILRVKSTGTAKIGPTDYRVLYHASGPAPLTIPPQMEPEVKMALAVRAPVGPTKNWHIDSMLDKQVGGGKVATASLVTIKAKHKIKSKAKENKTVYFPNNDSD